MHFICCVARKLQSPPKGATIPYRPKPQVGGPVILAGGQAYTIQGNYAVPATPDVSTPTSNSVSSIQANSSQLSGIAAPRGSHESDCCDALFVSASPSPTSSANPPVTSLGGCCAPMAARFAPVPSVGLEFCSPYGAPGPSPALPAPCPVLAYGPGDGGGGGPGGGPTALIASFPYHHHSVQPAAAFPPGQMLAVSPVTPLGPQPRNGTISLATVSVPLSLYVANAGGGFGGGFGGCPMQQSQALGTGAGGALAGAGPDAETAAAGAGAYSAAFPAPAGPTVHLDVSL